MNQQQQSGMQPARPAVSKWLWITLVVVIVIAGGFFAWFYLMGPGKTTETATEATTTIDPTANWKTYSNTVYSYSVKYPTDWEATEKTGLKDVNGKVYLSSVLLKPLSMKSDSAAGIYVQENSLADAILAQKKSFESNSKFIAESTKTIAGSSATSLSFENKTDATIKPVVYLIEKSNKVYILSGEGSMSTKDQSGVDINTKVKQIFSTFKFTTTTASTTTDLTYTNSTYGFTLTFPASWKGYKFKEATFEGSTKTYYCNIPTTDSTMSQASDMNDAGYYSPFAITVYTLAQWDALQSQEGPNITLITKNDEYAFAWSQANGVPPSDIGTKLDDIKTIIASFKLQ